jgi:hypothetical protein
MKKHTLLLLCLLAFVSTIHAQNNEIIIGTWKFQRIETKQAMDEIGKKMINEMFADLNMVMLADKNAQFSVMGKKEQGTWSLEKQKLKFKSMKGAETIYIIDQTHPDTLKITPYPVEDIPLYIILRREAQIQTAIRFTANKIEGVAIEKQQITKKWYFLHSRKTDSVGVNDNIVDKMFKGSFFNFKKDGTFEVLMGKLTESGTWELSVDKKEIIMNYSSKIKKYWKVLKATNNELILNLGDVKDEWTFSDKLPK